MSSVSHLYSQTPFHLCNPSTSQTSSVTSPASSVHSPHITYFTTTVFIQIVVAPSFPADQLCHWYTSHTPPHVIRTLIIYAESPLQFSDIPVLLLHSLHAPRVTPIISTHYLSSQQFPHTHVPFSHSSFTTCVTSTLPFISPVPSLHSPGSPLHSPYYP